MLHWQRRFGLLDWHICFEWQEQAPENTAVSMTIRWESHYRTAVISVYPQLLTLPVELVDQVLRHELIHLIFAGVDDEMSDMVGENGEVWRRYRNRNEEATDRLAITLGAW